MANEQLSSTFYKYAIVDTNPDADGFWTGELSIRDLRKRYNVQRVFFSIREYEADSSGEGETTITVRLQFKCPGDLGWQDLYHNDGDGFNLGERIALEDTAADVRWRAGCKDGDVTGSNSVIFGFDW